MKLLKISFLLSIFLNISFISFSQEYTVWPVKNGEHNVGATYGEYVGTSFGVFHNAIDMYGSGEIVAARSGTVEKIYHDSKGNSTIVIKADNCEEYDVYVHLTDICVTEYSHVDVGSKIAIIDTSTNHLHFSRLSYFEIGSTVGYAQWGINTLNPLDNFTLDIDKDPSPNNNTPVPSLDDRLENYNTVVFKKNNTSVFLPQPNLNLGEKQIVYGEVDILAEAYDNMFKIFHSGYTYSGNTIQSLSYYIESINPYGNDISTYKLLAIDNNWFHDLSLLPDPTSARNCIYEGTLHEHENTTFRSETHFIVTNTSSTNGSALGLDENQCWATNAKTDATTANGYCVTCNPAPWISQAKFADGEYIVHIVMEDLVNEPVDDGTTHVIVDNFTPIHRKVEIYNKNKKTVYYSKHWELNPSNLLQCTGFSNPIPPNADLSVTITVSEPAESVEFALDNNSFQPATKIDEFTYTFDIVSPPTKDTEHTIKLRSYDLAGNLNYGFSNTSDTYTPAHRTGNNSTDWSVPNCQGIDIAHKFTVGESLIYPDFDYEAFGNTVSFYDNSAPLNQISAWHWDFGDGSGSNYQNPNHYYSDINQAYSVTLTVFDLNNNPYQITKQIFGDNPQSEIDFTWSPTSPDGKTIEFECTTPDLYGYTWNLGDGESNYGESVSHSYMEYGEYGVTLSAYGAQGHIEKTKNIIVSDPSSGSMTVSCFATKDLFNDLTYNLNVSVFGCSGEKTYNFYQNINETSVTDFVYSDANSYTWQTTYPNEGHFDIGVLVQCSGEEVACSEPISVYDHTITDLSVAINVGEDTKALYFYFDVQSAFPEFAWDIKLVNITTNEVFEKSGASDTIHFDAKFFCLIVGEYYADIIVWDQMGRFYEETIDSMAVHPFHSSLVYVGLDMYSSHNLYKRVPLQLYNLLIVEKGSKFRQYFNFQPTKYACFDNLKFYKKTGIEPFVLTKENPYYSGYEFCEPKEGAFDPKWHFRESGNYKIKVKSKYINGNPIFPTYKEEDVKDIISIDSDVTKMRYKQGVKYGNNYFAGSFELNDEISNDKNISLYAVNKIILKPGFKTESGSRFVAQTRITTYEGYKSSKDSTATEEYRTVQNGEDITYIAYDKVVLRQGFSVQSGGNFLAYLTDCPEQKSPKSQAFIDKQNFTENIVIEQQTLEISPNPASNSIKISYFLPQETDYSIEIYDIFGKKLKELDKGNKKEGNYQFYINLSFLQNGVYFCVFKTSQGVISEKIVKI